MAKLRRPAVNRREFFKGAATAAAGYDYSCYACHGFTGETGARTFVPNWPANLATESTFIAFLRGRANLAPDQPRPTCRTTTRRP